MDLIRIEAPTAKLISLVEAKDHLRIDSTDEDGLISALIKSATTNAENFTQRSFMPQKWRLTLDNIPLGKTSRQWWDGVRETTKQAIFGMDNEIILKRGPIFSIDSFKYFTTGDVEKVFASTNYFLDSGNFKGRIILKEGKAWPTGLRNRLSIQIEYTAQMGSLKSEIPDDIREAVKLIISNLYENRGDNVALKSKELGQSVSTIPQTAKFLLSPYKAHGV